MGGLEPAAEGEQGAWAVAARGQRGPALPTELPPPRQAAPRNRNPSPAPHERTPSPCRCLPSRWSSASRAATRPRPAAGFGTLGNQSTPGNPAASTSQGTPLPLRLPALPAPAPSTGCPPAKLSPRSWAPPAPPALPPAWSTLEATLELAGCRAGSCGGKGWPRVHATGPARARRAGTTYPARRALWSPGSGRESVRAGPRQRGGEEEAVNEAAVPPGTRVGRRGGLCRATCKETAGRGLKNHTRFPILPICNTDSLISNRW